MMPKNYNFICDNIIKGSAQEETDVVRFENSGHALHLVRFLFYFCNKLVHKADLAIFFDFPNMFSAAAD